MALKYSSQVIIEPWDPAVNKAMLKINQIDSSLLKNVKKIIVHPGGGAGQLGHVESGPGKDPSAIHIFKDRIREHVMRNANATTKRTLTPQELEMAILDGLVETIGHEAGHIGKVLPTGRPFYGEPEAESGAKALMKRIRPANIEFKLSKRADMSFKLSKRSNIQMACPSCYEDISNINPEKNEVGLYKMMTCPSCKNSFYPQDALMAMKHREKQKLDVGNWPEKGWWSIWANGEVLGFVDSESKANLIKNTLVNRFTENGSLGLGWMGYIAHNISTYFMSDLAGEVFEVGFPEEKPEIAKITDEGYDDVSSILSGKGKFIEKMRKEFLEKAIHIGKSKVSPSYQSIIQGGLPTYETCENAEDDLKNSGSNEYSTEIKKSREVFEKAKDKLISGPLKTTINKIRAFKDGIDPSLLCDDGSKKKVNEFILNSALSLEEIREKLLPNYTMAEPDLSFATLVANNNKKHIIRHGISLIKNENESSIINEINNAQQFNYNILKTCSNTKLYPRIAQLLLNYNDYDLVIAIADWQYKNNIKITGKLDEDTLETFPHQSFNSKVLPRNFGVVVPGRLYRGGVISDEGQLQSLKNLGIKRVVSLHSNPDVARLCNSNEIEYVPAFIENGGKEDLGRKVFGSSVSEFLLQTPTYIHCFFGEDRTGGVIARFRTETGWPCKMAYAEAKSYGFKDIFVDLIDWFSEFCREKPINTDKIRKLMTKEPYQNPEVLSKEQECSLPTPAPNDVPFEDSEPTSFPSYKSYITSEIPTSISTVPFSVSSSFKNAQESNVETSDIEEEIEENPEESADDIFTSIEINAYEVRNQENEKEDENEEEDVEQAVNIVGLEEDGTKSNCNQGLALEPFFDTETIG